MPVEYFIQELTGGKQIPRGSKFTAAEAEAEAIRLHRETGNPIDVSPQWIPNNQIGEMKNIFDHSVTASEFRQLNLRKHLPE